ncbi:hypothetical protein C8Q74DRAFT_1417939 [Fomes fomentarius]|nr:hypothetical protein C8Q74DRAFT_1417939 [Fomes fomentarius]
MQADYPPLAELSVPAGFVAYDEQTESETVVYLEAWKRKAHDVLTSLREHLRTRRALETRHQAEIVYAVAPFDGEEAWVLEPAREVAQDILSSYISPNTELTERVLRDFIKPIFQPNPHPQLNVETGRKLPRPAGGPLGHLDYLEGQDWKSQLAISDVISWCITHTDARTVERLWHLYIPPIMTLLDDHQARYKLQGARLVSQLLYVTPADLLRRTGIDTLLLTSLKTCLTFLHDPETPKLVRATVSATLRLIDLTTDVGSASRFEQLCTLLGDSIIGNIWIYASQEPDAIQASVDAIPEIVRLLDVGTARYLKALIPQLTYPLIPSLENGASISFKRSSLQALCAVMEACAPRIHKWRGTILDAILKCWVDIADRDVQDSDQMREQLRSAYVLLKRLCQPISHDFEAECSRILVLDQEIFSPLLESVA